MYVCSTTHSFNHRRPQLNDIFQFKRRMSDTNKAMGIACVNNSVERFREWIKREFVSTPWSLSFAERSMRQM